MFKRFIVVVLLCLTSMTARAGLTNLNYRGEMRGAFNDVVVMTNSISVWRVTMQATNTDSSSEFLFENTSYANKWARGDIVSLDTPTIAYASGANSLHAQTAGRFYTFGLKDTEIGQNSTLIIMETTNAPISLTSQSNDAATAGTGPVTAWINLSAAPCDNESVWIRWTTNNFATSIIGLASGAGANRSFVVPGQPVNTTVKYYWLTTTVSSNTLASEPDLSTIHFLNSGGTNYSYGVMGFGNSWHYPANTEPPGAYMRNPPTNGVPPSADVFIYSGTYTNDSDQTGGSLFYRKVGDAAFTEKSLSFDTNQGGGNQYWKAAITGNTFGVTNEVEYFLKITYNNRATTFIGTTNNANAGVNVKYGTTNAVATNTFRFTYGGPAFNLGNCWHAPASTEPPGVTMRNPLSDSPTNSAVFIYNGNQFQGAGNPGDQSGGTLYFRKVGDVSWLSTALMFNAESGDVGNNKFWRGRIPAIFGTTNQVEYYLAVTYTDHDTTYLGTTNQTSSFTTGYESVAQTNTFKYTYSPVPGTAAAFLWHNNNRVTLSGSNVQFWVKVGYAQGTGSNRFVDFANIYYTTDGSAPLGAYGVATNAGTSVQAMQFDHMEEDSYEDGDAMWWVGTASNLPQFTTIKYRIGAYKDSNGVERFADYGSGTNNQTFSFSLGDVGAESLVVNGQSADYTATKFFIDEIAGDAVTVTVVYTTGTTNSGTRAVEIFSNLGRRDFADVDYTNASIAADGIPDGIKAPDGNLLTTNDVGSYYRAWPMTYSGSGSTYVWTGVVSKTGAYRLTARYQLNSDGSNTWTYFTRNGRRDHAVVVSPKKALEMTLYELNALTVEATDATEAGRSTFQDLLGAADGDSDGFDPFNLDYLNYIQANCLWFQPIHPVGYDRSENDPATGQPYAPGSPYATRNYWAVNGKMGSDGTEATAMQEFSNYVSKCDSYTGSVGTVNVMLDGVFNHTSWDAEFGQPGVDAGYCTNAHDRIGWFRPNWYSLMTDYGLPATFYNSAYDNNFATAPDRGDFGKWSDVSELYFGRYSALVRHNPDNNGDYLNEGDVFDASSMSSGVTELWRYFAYYPEYWLKKTGHSGTNSYVLAQDNKGIDGLRCDFGQGLPPQLWEYIINRTRSKKWNFIFMAETLDGGIPGYRSNRHFDILNENMVFQFTQSHISDSSGLSYALYTRNLAYNGGAILLNITSHDEVLPSDDPWLNASRYAAVSSVAGLPMVFYGQEQGIKNYSATDPTYDGFSYHELNFGKYVPNFKRWNKLLVWENPPPDSAGMAQWYGRVNWARLNSPALRSRNYRTLASMAGPEDSGIFAVAKWEKPGVGPANGDVVLAFSRFLEHGAGHASDANVFNLQPVWSELGLNTGKTYTVRNLASSNAFADFTNGWPKTGADLYANGIYVSLGAGTVNPITTDGEIVQYLRLVEVTNANQAPIILLPGPHIVAVGASTNFAVTASDPDGGSVTLLNSAVPAGATFVEPNFTWSPGPAFENTTNQLVFVANDNDGATNSIVTNSTTIVVPFDYDGDGIGDGWEYGYFNTLTNGAAGDSDGDGVNNFDEYVARTVPTNGSSVFKVTSEVSAGVTNRLITVSTQPGRLYRIYFADNSVTNAWTAFANSANGVGTWIETNVVPGAYSFRDDETASTSLGPPANGRRSYRVTVQSP